MSTKKENLTVQGFGYSRKRYAPTGRVHHSGLSFLVDPARRRSHTYLISRFRRGFPAEAGKDKSRSVL